MTVTCHLMLQCEYVIQIKEFSSNVASGYVNTLSHYSLNTSVVLACPHELLLYSSLWYCFALSVLKTGCVKCLVKLPGDKAA